MGVVMGAARRWGSVMSRRRCCMRAANNFALHPIPSPDSRLPEAYQLHVACAVPQEALLPRSSPQLTLRAALRLHERGAPITLLEQVWRARGPSAGYHGPVSRSFLLRT
jgi:hypothetical protein